MKFENIDEARDFTNEKIEELRQNLSKLISKNFSGINFTIVTGGSFARREASPYSDIDFFIIYANQEDKEIIKSFSSQIRDCICSIVKKPPAPNGAFNKFESIDSMLKNVGGQEDVNDKITRRILFLVEGDYLYNLKSFQNYRERIIKKYIKTRITDHQLSMFFLNDIVRYYRTVCVDFEYKTLESGKSWATRNIKLIYSRKLLYFSAILVCAETLQRSYKEKIEITKKLLSLTPIERIQKVCGSRAERALKLYDEFLGKISKEDIRRELDRLTMNNARKSELFLRLKNGGHHFTWELLKLLENTYHSTHLIHRAIIF